MSKIPIVKHHSTKLDDVIGSLDISDDLAEYMAQCYENKLTFHIEPTMMNRGDEGLEILSLTLSAHPMRRAKP